MPPNPLNTPKKQTPQKRQTHSKKQPSKGVLFVCTGNICRSPLAEAVFRAKLKKAGKTLLVDSAGTTDFHQGEAADPRAIATAHKRGYDASSLKARALRSDDIHNFNRIIAMSRSHFDWMVRFFGNNPSPHPSLSIFPDGDGNPIDIPDPYYGGDEGFEKVLDLIEIGCDKLLTQC